LLQTAAYCSILQHTEASAIFGTFFVFLYAHSKRHLQIHCKKKGQADPKKMPTGEKEGNGNSNLGWEKREKTTIFPNNINCL